MTGGYRAEPHEGERACPSTTPGGGGHAGNCSTQCTGPVGHEGLHRCGCTLSWVDGIRLDGPDPVPLPCSSLSPDDLKHTGLLCSGRCVSVAGHPDEHRCRCRAKWLAFAPAPDDTLELPADDALEVPPRDDPAERLRTQARGSLGKAGEVAQARALLSISEETRTANLIAAIAAGVLTGPATKRAGDLVRHRLGNP